MVRLGFYGGVGEIGGSKLLLEDDDTRIFLDFGMSFGRRGSYYGDFLGPRTANGLGDFLEMGLVPDLKGLYRTDLLATVGRKAEPPEIDAVLLSHAHLDHSRYISFLHEKIPVYCGETCHLILQALQEAGSRDIESEILDFKTRPITDRMATPVKREYRTFRTGQKLRIGGLEVEPVHVDHSIPGNYGFIIYTSAGAVVYTSDLRLHGTKPEMTREFIEKAKAADPMALICEGTRISEKSKGESEEKVRRESAAVVTETRKFAAADFNFKDVDRFRTFFEIAKKSGRKLAVTLGDAFLLKYLSRDPVLAVPAANDENIVITIPKRGSGGHTPEDYDPRERQFLKYSNAWNAERIGKNQRKLIGQITFYNMNELIDIRPESGSVYIHSMSEPFNEEMLVDQKRLENWLSHFRMRLVQSHASGHAAGDEILQLVQEIRPKRLFPVHTEFPNMFQRSASDIQIVQYGEAYNL